MSAATKKTTGRRPAKKAAVRPPRQPADRKPKAEVSTEPRPISAEDYGVDTAQVMRLLGIDPGTVLDNSVRLALLDGAIVMEYQVRRAVPPRIMGMALLSGAAHTEEKEQDDEGDSDG